ncbi:LuxR C-terminal-related transcriptional regulator [Streptomyces iakyrus]|uniref:LuxR C-terminal-related transcriptional regulator n=1 Tax=Streptomyces iakyrus TaxID=68219 RepID=UPI003D8F5283
MTGDRSRGRTAPRARGRYGRDATRSSVEDRGHAELARGRRQLFDGPVDDARETLLLAASLLAPGAPDGAEAARLCAADAAWASGDVTACLTALDDADPPEPTGGHAAPDTAPAGEPACDRSAPTTGGVGSGPTTGVDGDPLVSALDCDALASGLGGSAPATGGTGGTPATGGAGGTPVSGPAGDAPVSGRGGSAARAGGGGSGAMSGLGGDAPKCGLGGDAAVSGLEGGVAASGLGDGALTTGRDGGTPVSGRDGGTPVSGWVGGTPVSGSDRDAPVSGLGGSVARAGGGGSRATSGLYGVPTAGGDVDAPVSGLGGDAPASGPDGSAPTTGRDGGTPVSGPDGDALVSGLGGSVQAAGGSGSGPVFGPGGGAPVSGPDGRPPATDGADGGSPPPGVAGLGVPPAGTGREGLRGSGWGRDRDPFFRDYRDGMRALLVRRPELAAGPLRRVLNRVRHDDPPERLLRAASAALLLGDVHAARAAGARALAVARNADCVASEARALEYLAYGELRAGRHAQARAHAEEGVRAALLAGHRNTAASHHALLALAASIEGDTAAVAGYASAALATARRHGLAQAATLAEWATARADLARGRPLDAADRLGPLVGPGPRRGHFAVWMLAVPCFVEAAVLAGQPEDARGPVGDLARWADFGADPHASAQLARCRALLAADDREADDLYLRALALHDGSGGDFERARTELLYGRWLRRRRRLREARGRLGAALVAFERCGAGAWADQTRGELRANGAASGKEPAAGLARLTPQQLRIARHVAEGATNREVAQRLAVSTRTVDYHLRNVFAALGVRSRVELARMVDQEHR